MRRWLLRTLLVLILIIVAGAVTVQMVLWSDWPRRRVIADLQSETGLVVDAAYMRTGWSGRSTLGDVTIRLPLSDEPIIALSRLEVNHTAVIPMIASRHVDIKSLRSEGTVLRIEEDALGTWNVQRLVQMMLNRPKKESRVRDLPQIEARDVQITLYRTGREPVELPKSHFTGGMDGALVWRLSGEIESLAKLEGRISQSANAMHHIELQTGDLQNLVASLTQWNHGAPLLISGTWHGAVRNQALTGRLLIDRATLPHGALTGSAAITVADGTLKLDDPDLQITVNNAVADHVRVSSGELRWNGAAITADHLSIDVDDHEARISGEFDLDGRSGELTADWRGTWGLDASHTGTIHAALELPQAGTQRITTQLNATAHVAGGRLTATMNTKASGFSWRDLTAAVSFPTFSWSDADRTVDLRGLEFTFTSEWPMLRVAGLNAQGADVRGSGEFNAESKVWSAFFSLKQSPLPAVSPLANTPVDFAFEAWGNQKSAELVVQRFAFEGFNLSGNAFYAPNSAESIGGRISAQVRLPSSPPSQESAATTDTAPRLPDSSVDADIAFRGNHQPLALVLSGTVKAAQAPMPGADIQQLTIPIAGTLDSRAVLLESQPFPIWQGESSLRCKLDHRTGLVSVHINSTSLAIRELLSAVDSPLEATGSVSASCDIEVPLRDLQALTAQGSWTAEGISTIAGPIGAASGTVAMQNGVLDLPDIQLLSEDRTGSFHGRAQYTPANRQVVISGTCESWPSPLREGSHLVTSGGAELQLYLSTRSASGTAHVQTNVFVNGELVGNIDMSAAAVDTSIHLTRLEGNLLSGTFSGSGVVPLTEWQKAQANVLWADVDISRLGRFVPALESLEGIAFGSASLSPATDVRAVAPLRLDLTNELREGSSRSIAIGQTHLTAFGGADAITIDRATTEIAGGTLNLWGRLTKHGSDRFAHVQANFENVNLNQVAHWARPNAKDIPGVLRGEATAGGYLRSPHRMFGQATVSLAESDLVNIPFVALLHNTLNLKIGQIEPSGQGTANLRLEGNSLEMTRLEYFNHGTDIVASIRVADITQGTSSSIEGVAIGAIRPLKKIDIPYFNDLDRALKAVQTGASSVRISGTVADPKEELVPFAEISSAVRRLFSGSD